MTTGDEPVGYEPTDYVPTGPLYSQDELEQFKPPVAAGGELTGYENTGPLFSKEELEQLRPTRKRRKLDWATAGTVGTSLGIVTTAEGVETIEQFEQLKLEGCNEVQGYLFSPPRPASEVKALLAAFGPRLKVVA